MWLLKFWFDNKTFFSTKVALLEYVDAYFPYCFLARWFQLNSEHNLVALLHYLLLSTNSLEVQSRSCSSCFCAWFGRMIRQASMYGIASVHSGLELVDRTAAGNLSVRSSKPVQNDMLHRCHPHRPWRQIPYVCMYREIQLVLKLRSAYRRSCRGLFVYFTVWDW